MVLTSSDEDDEPIVSLKPKAVPKETQDAGEKRKTDSSAAEEDSMESMVDLTSSPVSSPAKKVKLEPAKAQKEQPKNATQQSNESGEFSDDDEEARFMALMTQHGSASYAPPKPPTPTKPVASASSLVVGSAKNVKEEKGVMATTEETANEKWGSAKVGAYPLCA